jgi:glycosyltransferase involved in cell wall biosynthesis
MKVLLVNNQLRLGGAETIVHQLLSGIPESRLLVAETYESGVEVMYPRILSRLNHSRFHDLIEKCFPMFEWTNRSFSRLREDPADIIHIHNFHGTYATVEALADLAKMKRVVWTFHGLWGVTGGCDHPKGCRRYLEQCGHCPQLGLWPIGNIDRTADELSRKLKALAGIPLRVIAPSRYFLQVIRSSQIGRHWTVHHIPNGIDPKKFAPAQATSGKLKILIVNRNFQDPHKGFSMLSQALSMVDPSGFDLTLVGMNSDWAIRQLKPEFRARDLGYITDQDTMAQLYCESHVFLFASPAENFPCVILEAMASGCCVVATPSGGVVEQITDGENGILAADVSGQSLAAALERALATPEKLSELGESARRTVSEKFNEDAMIGSHVQLYQSLLK